MCIVFIVDIRNDKYKLISICNRKWEWEFITLDVGCIPYAAEYSVLRTYAQYPVRVEEVMTR